MHRFVLGFIALLVTLPSLFAQDKVTRPRITGIHHVRIYVSDMERSRGFYSGVLGYAAADPRCTGPSRSCLAVSWGAQPQHIELEQVPTPAPNDWLAEVSFTTDDVVQLRDYLVAHGLIPGPISKHGYGAQRFEVRDPEDHLISFVAHYGTVHEEHAAASRPVSTRIIHAGFVVNDRAKMDHFYKDILGFRPYWHGGMKDTDTDWVAMQVPDGTDWLEYMLNISSTADRQELGVMNHISLGVKDIKVAAAAIQPNLSKIRADDSPKIGRDGKWQYNIYDPDDTRVEFMEFAPVQKPCCSEITGPNPKP